MGKKEFMMKVVRGLKSAGLSGAQIGFVIPMIREETGGHGIKGAYGHLDYTMKDGKRNKITGSAFGLMSYQNSSYGNSKNRYHVYDIDSGAILDNIGGEKVVGNSPQDKGRGARQMQYIVEYLKSQGYTDNNGLKKVFEIVKGVDLVKGVNGVLIHDTEFLNLNKKGGGKADIQDLYNAMAYGFVKDLNEDHGLKGKNSYLMDEFKALKSNDSVKHGLKLSTSKLGSLFDRRLARFSKGAEEQRTKNKNTHAKNYGKLEKSVKNWIANVNFQPEVNTSQTDIIKESEFGYEDSFKFDKNIEKPEPSKTGYSNNGNLLDKDEAGSKKQDKEKIEDDDVIKEKNPFQEVAETFAKYNISNKEISNRDFARGYDKDDTVKEKQLDSESDKKAEKNPFQEVAETFAKYNIFNGYKANSKFGKKIDYPSE
jgi:hypothetical protein